MANNQEPAPERVGLTPRWAIDITDGHRSDVLPRNETVEMYLKSEADSLIQSKDAEIQRHLTKAFAAEGNAVYQQRRAERAESESQSLRERVEELEKENSKLIGRRKHTQQWYASHYGKLEDWARKRLPEPWRNEFFSCIANGTWGHADVGERYRCKAGFDVVPSGYIHMEDAKGQLVLDQTSRAELAEERAAQLESQLQWVEVTPETMPKKGVPVDLWIHGEPSTIKFYDPIQSRTSMWGRTTNWMWDGERWCAVEGLTLFLGSGVKATHWRHRPPPPATGSKP